MSQSVEFVAETDEIGQVACVWRVGRKDYVARPVSDARKAMSDLKSAKVWGASREAVSDWLARNCLR